MSSTRETDKIDKQSSQSRLCVFQQRDQESLLFEKEKKHENASVELVTPDFAAIAKKIINNNSDENIFSISPQLARKRWRRAQLDGWPRIIELNLPTQYLSESPVLTHDVDSDDYSPQFTLVRQPAHDECRVISIEYDEYCSISKACKPSYIYHVEALKLQSDCLHRLEQIFEDAICHPKKYRFSDGCESKHTREESDIHRVMLKLINEYKNHVKVNETSSAIAYANLGDAYCYGIGDIQQDEEMAFQCYQKAAEKNCAYAQKQLGVCYANGMGVKKDLNKAFAWFLSSAEQWNADARFYVANCYEHGMGVEKDDMQASAWYEKAAYLGHKKSLSHLVNLYEQGRVISKKSTVAMGLYKEIQHPIYCYNVANLAYSPNEASDYSAFLLRYINCNKAWMSEQIDDDMLMNAVKSVLCEKKYDNLGAISEQILNDIPLCIKQYQRVSDLIYREACGSRLDQVSEDRVAKFCASYFNERHNSIQSSTSICSDVVGEIMKYEMPLQNSVAIIHELLKARLNVKEKAEEKTHASSSRQIIRATKKSPDNDINDMIEAKFDFGDNYLRRFLKAHPELSKLANKDQLLIAAVQLCDVKAVESLLRIAPFIKINAPVQPFALNALHAAALAKNDEIFKLILAMPCVNVNAKTDTGMTACHFAASSGYIFGLKNIIQNDAVLLDEQDSSGYTPRHEAAERGHQDVYDLFLAHSTRLNLALVDKLGRTAEDVRQQTSSLSSFRC